MIIKGSVRLPIHFVFTNLCKAYGYVKYLLLLLYKYFICNNIHFQLYNTIFT